MDEASCSTSDVSRLDAIHRRPLSGPFATPAARNVIGRYWLDVEILKPLMLEPGIGAAILFPTLFVSPWLWFGHRAPPKNAHKRHLTSQAASRTPDSEP
jgi:hypothetical protein